MATEQQEKDAIRISNRIQKALNDAQKLDLVVMAVGDGKTLSVYTKEDYDSASDVDVAYGISDANGNRVEPLATIDSSAMKY